MDDGNGAKRIHILLGKETGFKKNYLYYIGGDNRQD